jgi:hypothetical protein
VWFPNWIDAALLALVLTGAVLLVIGLRGRREGRDPHCRRCGYNLTGLDRAAPDARCPECGGGLAGPRTVRIGRRARRRRPLAWGAALFLVGAAPLSGSVAALFYRVDLYGLLPVSVMIYDLRDPDSPTFSRALVQLHNRFFRGDLSAEQVSRIAEIALAIQAAPAERPGVSRPLIGLLGAFYTRRLLTPEQTQRMFENAVQFAELRVRPTVISGWEFPVVAASQLRFPGRVADVTVRAVDLRVVRADAAAGDTPAPRIRRSTEPGAEVAYVRVASAGSYQIEYGAEVEIRSLPTSHRPEPELLYRRALTLRAPFTVLAEMPTDYVRFMRQPELGELMTDAVRLARADIVAPKEPGTAPVLSLTIRFEPELPAAVAFDVHVVRDGREERIGFASSAARPRFGRDVVLEWALPEPPAALMIRLRSSAEAAHGTIDLAEIWGGALEFEDVPLSPAPLQPASAPSADVYGLTPSLLREP